MHLSSQTLAAAASSPWIIPGPMMETPGLGLALTFSVDANLTAGVQHTLDDPMQNLRAVSITRVGTVATINDPGHNLNVGDNIQVSQDPSGTFGPVPPVAGGPAPPASSYDLATVVDANNYTITVPNAGSLGPVIAQIQSFRVFNHATLTNISGTPPGRLDGNYAFQIGACRLKVTGYTAGKATLTAQQGKGY
jgi:hypothetical protein